MLVEEPEAIKGAGGTGQRGEAARGPGGTGAACALVKKTFFVNPTHPLHLKIWPIAPPNVLYFCQRMVLKS